MIDRIVAQFPLFEQLAPMAAIVLAMAALLWLAWFALRRFARRQQTRFEAQAAHLQRRLLRIEATRTGLSQESRAYTPTDPEPYGSIATELQQVLAWVSQGHDDQLWRLAGLYRHLPASPQNWPGRLVFSLWTEPRHWQRHYRAAAALWQETQGLQFGLDQAARLLQRLQRLPLETARCSRELYGVNEETAQLVQTLYLSGLGGHALDLAADNVAQLADRLKSLPLYFFQEDETTVLEQAGKESTVLAWQTLGQIEPPLRQYRDRFAHWQKVYQDLDQQVQTMRRAAGTAQQCLNRVPPEVDLSQHRVELEQAGTEVDELSARFRAPTVEILDELSARVADIIDILNWLVKQADTLTTGLRRLQFLIISCTELLAQTQARMAETFQAEGYPLTWTEWHEEMARLVKFKDDIGPIDRRRTPAELEQHLAQAEQWHKQVTALQATVDEILAQRDSFISLLRRPELADEPAWLIQARNLHQQLSRYGAKNWPSGDDVTRIWDSARKLAAQAQSLAPGDAGPIPAGHMSQTLNQAQAVLGEIEGFQARLRRTEEMLVSLQQQEQEAGLKLDETFQVVELLYKHLQRAGLPRDSALQKHQKQLDKLRRDGRNLMSGQGKRKTGTVAEWDRRITGWIESCLEGLQGIYQELGSELTHLGQELEQELKALQAIAPLEREGSVRTARQLLETKFIPPAGLFINPARSQPELLAEEIKTLLSRADTFRQSLQLVQKQVAEQVKPRYRKMTGMQQEARAMFQKLEQVSNEAGWPPIACDLKPAHQLLHQAEQEQARLLQSGHTARDVTSGLETTFRYYESARDRAREMLADLLDERSRLEDMLNRIDQWQRRLELYRAHHHEDHVLVKAVSERLNLIAEKKAAARRPQLSPEQVRRLLEELERAASQDLQVRRDGKHEVIPAAHLR